MKKALVIFAIAAVAIFLSVSIAESQSSTDYKIIKNAVKNNGGAPKNPEDLILHLDVKNTKTNKTTVKIEVPFNLVEYLIENCNESAIKLEGKEAFKLREAIKRLKASGPMTIIEINNFEDENSSVRIWLE